MLAYILAGVVAYALTTATVILAHGAAVQYAVLPLRNRLDD